MNTRNLIGVIIVWSGVIALVNALLFNIIMPVLFIEIMIEIFSLVIAGIALDIIRDNNSHHNELR